MTDPPRVLFISTYPPQQCGIATFTQHLIAGLPHNGAPQDVRVAAVIRKDERPAFGDRVVYRIPHGGPTAYRDAAEAVNGGAADAVCLQHEFGLFSGEWGADVVAFLEACRRPVVTTLHTILPTPNSRQREITRAVARRSRRLVVMANIGIDLLASVYGVARQKMVYIPHGVPDVRNIDRADARKQLNLQQRKVILTFGLLSRGKGIEHVIDALPDIRRNHPDVLYLVVGRTHPNIKRIEGESYREELKDRARQHGVSRLVRFENRFVKDAELLPYLRACDVYVTPYLGRDQITSGTLSYAVAAGCAVVSTPYLYAVELLAGGRGRLADFHSAESLAHQVNAILDNPALQHRLMQRAYRHGQSMTWKRVGLKYHALFGEMIHTRGLQKARPRTATNRLDTSIPMADDDRAAGQPHVHGA